MFAQNFPELSANVRASYDAMGHAYHNWDHITALLELLKQVEAEFAHPEAVEIAVYFHDVVYDPMSSDNETLSAQRMLDDMSGRIDEQTLGAANLLIRATAAHLVPEDAGPLATDCALFLDMDLSILGASPDVFDRYDAAIRSEYAHVPWDQYRPARRAVMQRFLERPSIYFSDLFQDKYEQQAHKNLKILIDRLGP